MKALVGEGVVVERCRRSRSKLVGSIEWCHEINQVEKRCSLGTVLFNGSDQMLRVSAD